jgi:hypothetical protein
MSFMQLQIHKGDGWIIRTDNGDMPIPDWDAPDVDALRQKIGEKVCIGDFCGYLESVDYIKRGWWARMSAPGYLDCSPWEFDTSERRIRRTMRDLYGDLD